MALGGVVDFDALAPAVMRSDPFRWGHVSQALGTAAARALRDAFPTTGYWRLEREHHGSPMSFETRPLVPLGGNVMVAGGPGETVWRQLVEDLLSPAYRDASARALDVALDDALLEVSAWRWGPAAELGPHPDLPRKIASEVFYFNEGWDPAWGGCLRILRSSDPGDCVAEVAPELGSASLLVRSEHSWHAVSPVTSRAAQERLSVIATWQHAGSESPFWSVGPDGRVACRAPGSRYQGGECVKAAERASEPRR